MFVRFPGAYLLSVLLLAPLAHGDFGDNEGTVESIGGEPVFYDARKLPEGMGGSFDKRTGMWIPPHDGISMTWDPVYQRDSNVRQVWRPNRDGQPEDFEFLVPEMCAANAVNATKENKLPGFGSKRVALVFRGDSLRGMSYGINLDGVGKSGFYCTDLAMAIGEATAKAHLKYLVEPLEAAGFTVDIYLSGYGCTGLKHLTKQQADERYQDMVAWYGKRVVAHSVFDRTWAENYFQDTGTQQAMFLLLKTAPLNYHSVILWRYDMVPYKPIGAPRCSYDLSSDEGTKCFHDAQDDGSIPEWQNYVLLAERNLYFIEDDWGYSWPGWFSNCAVGAFMHHCMAESTVCIREMQINFQGGWPNRQWKNPRGNKNWYIYRENYSMYGKKICHILHEEFDGPPCPETGEEAWKLACADAKSKGTFDHIDSNPVSCGTWDKQETCAPGVLESCQNKKQNP